MGFVLQDNRTPRWKAWLMALLGMGAAGCMPVHEDYVSMRPARPMVQTTIQKTGPVMYIVDPAAVADGRFAPGDQGTGDSWPVHAQRLPNMALNLQR